jgi:ABC-type glycerol-3-phosphate transport system substrate-binding protein
LVDTADSVSPNHIEEEYQMKLGNLWILVLVSIFILSACSKTESQSTGESGGSGEKITLRLTWSGDGQNKELLDNCLAKYTDKTGMGVDVVFIPGGWAAYFTKIQTMIAGGDYLDLCNVAIEGFEMLVKTGMAAPIDDWIVSHRAEYDAVVQDISPNVMAFMNFGGKQYGIPNEWNNVVTHINTNLLAEAGLPPPPPDWGREEFIRYAKAMTKKLPDGTMQYGVAVPNYYFGFQAWLYNNGVTYMTPDFKKSLLLDPGVVEMFQFMYDLIYTYQVSPIPQGDLGVSIENNNLGMSFAGRWPTNAYVANNFRDVTVQYVPKFKTNVPVWGGTGAFTLKNSRHFDEATSLGLYLASAPFVEEWMAYGAIPVLESTAEKLLPALGIPQNYNIFIESAPLARAVQSPAQYAEIAQLVERAMTDILVNKADIMTILKAADVELNLILADN